MDVDTVLFNTDDKSMDSQPHAAQLVEMNQAVRLLWRHGDSLQDLGASVIVDVPMALTVGSQIEVHRSTPAANLQLRGHAASRGWAQLNTKGPSQWTPQR